MSPPFATIRKRAPATPARRAVDTEGNVLSKRAGAAESAAAGHTPGIGLLDLILDSLREDKAEDIVSIDLRGKSEMADHMVVASGRSSRQVSAICEKLATRLKQGPGLACRIEGKAAADWVLMDCGDVIVHVFRPEVREFYQREKMWLPDSRAARD